MKKVKFLALVGIALVVLGGLVSCKVSPSTSIEIKGTWDGTSGYGEQLIVTETRIENYYSGTLSWGADIIRYDNTGFNAEETGENDCGYVVMEYNPGTSYTPTGTFTVLRWQNLTDSTMQYSAGYGTTQFDSADGAEAGVTDADGYFYSYPDYNKQ